MKKEGWGGASVVIETVALSATFVGVYGRLAAVAWLVSKEPKRETAGSITGALNSDKQANQL